MAERQQGANQALPVGMAAQECIKLADLIALQLGQKETDVIDQLTNNDFQGDFFRIGDTVQVVAIDPNAIKVVEGDKNDIRPTLDRIAFSATTMVIDRTRKFGFQIRDLDRLEDRWNHESAAHAIAARQMRRANCLDILNLITADGNITTFGTVTNPIDLTALTGDAVGNKLFRLINRMKEELRVKGAIDGEQYTYGANKTVQLRGTASLFVAPGIHTALLNSQYLRVDDVTEDVIRNGKYEKFAGLLLNSAPALDSDYAEHIDILEGKTGIGVIILGTKNTVTRAGKVLPPEKMRDHVQFADNYYGREIYGRMIACPEAAVMAVVKYGDEFAEAKQEFTNDGLFVQQPIENPVRVNDDPTLAGRNNFPQLANLGYMNEVVTADDVTGLATVAKSGVYGDLTNIPTTFTPAAHTHAQADVNNLTTDLANKSVKGHTHGGVTAGDAATGVDVDPVQPEPENPETQGEG